MLCYFFLIPHCFLILPCFLPPGPPLFRHGVRERGRPDVSDPALQEVWRGSIPLLRRRGDVSAHVPAPQWGHIQVEHFYGSRKCCSQLKLHFPALPLADCILNNFLMYRFIYVVKGFSSTFNWLLQPLHFHIVFNHLHVSPNLPVYGCQVCRLWLHTCRSFHQFTTTS